MSKSRFCFKKFTVYQDKAAMKVGTDGTLLGAWADVTQAQHALDIGCGTGLIGLMLAQRNADVLVDAIDVDEGACTQTQFNFKRSPWSTRLKVCHSSLQDYVDTSGAARYESIVCNPPFYSSGKKSSSLQKSVARHSTLLSFEELVSCSVRLLTESGKLSVVIPSECESAFVSICRNTGLFPARFLRIRPTPLKEYRRVLFEFSIKPVEEIEEDEMILEEFGRHKFSAAYKALMADFQMEKYLK